MTELHGHYHAGLVVLSILAAMLASYVALSLVPRIYDAASSRLRVLAWTIVFGVSMGAGIWTMHFIAMLALTLPIPVRYDPWGTGASLLVAVAITGAGVWPLSWGGEMTGVRLAVVGSMVGLGIAAMHYTGMAAMRMAATVRYDPWLVALSVVIAMGAATAALWLANRLRRAEVLGEAALKLPAAVAMGVAVSAMHYTGMAAVHFDAAPDMPAVLPGLDASLLVAGLVGVFALVQGGTLVLAAVDDARAAVTRRLEEERERLRQSRFYAGLNRLLEIAVGDPPLDSRLRQALETMMDQPWLGLEAKGAVFERRGEALHMRASVNLGELATVCARVATGQCLCGKVLANGSELIRMHVDDDHTTRPAGMHDHGHAIFPLRGRQGMLGVLCLYLPAGHGLDEEEHAFLSSAARVFTQMLSREQMQGQLEMLRLAIEQTPEGVFITDGDGYIVYANPAAAHMTGLSREALLGRLAAEVRGGARDDALFADIMEHMREGRPWLGDVTYTRPGGERRIVERHIAPVVVDGETRWYVCVDTDVTEQRRTRERLEHAQRLESLGVLAGGIAHDFNNILTAIMGNAAVAESQLDPLSPAKDHLERIVAASERAADLCRQMLAYSGKGKFVVKPIDLSELVREMGRLLEVSIAKNVVLKYHLAEGLPAVEADVAQLQQVIMNLITNASEAIGEASGVISITTGVMHADRDYLTGMLPGGVLRPGRYVFLEVADTGRGMDAEVQRRIFDPFFSTKFAGRGLGMSAVLGIVRGHHGAIKLYSEPGCGTTFKVLLPSIEASAVPLVRRQEEHSGWHGEGTVLVVDDEETIREVAAMMLGDMGFAVLTASDGEEGVAVYRKHQDEIVAVLLDMTMPKMNGEEAFRELRRINPKVKVVLSSGYNEQDATTRFAGKGLAGFIQKPYTPEKLAAKMREVLDQA